MTLERILAERPSPGQPRTYHFPSFERTVLPSGLQVLAVHVPGRPLVSANLVYRRGSGDEPSDLAGATVLAARAMTEGTERYPGVELIEAGERLGATLHVETTWDAFVAGVEVAASRLEAALELLEELVERPTFPDEDVARLRDERLNDLMQARADPRRRAERAFTATIYASDSPYSRPSGGDEDSVPRLSSEALRTVHRSILAPDDAALIVGGDLTGLSVPSLAAKVLGSLGGGRQSAGTAAVPAASSAVSRPLVRFYHRPGSVQTELRIGQVGLPRLIPDFHAVGVMAAILGGLFNSRLQMNLREEKGYTYGVGAGFDMRRGAGPFAVRTAVQTASTVPAIIETLSELRRIRETEVTKAELAAARDYLVGVFPLRFETPGAVVGALGGLFVHGLPDDELDRYRDATEAVTIADVQTAAREHIDLDRIAIVAVGDADAVGAELEAAGLGELETITEEQAEGTADDEGEADSSAEADA
ncbi:MAG: M16 family metallopeptidase [Candidatus Limnocylindrales bacterium]